MYKVTITLFYTSQLSDHAAVLKKKMFLAKGKGIGPKKSSSFNSNGKPRGPMGHIVHLSNAGLIRAFKGYSAIWPLGRLTKNQYPNFSLIFAYGTFHILTHLTDEKT